MLGSYIIIPVNESASRLSVELVEELSAALFEQRLSKNELVHRLDALLFSDGRNHKSEKQVEALKLYGEEKATLAECKWAFMLLYTKGRTLEEAKSLLGAGIRKSK